MSTMLVNKFKTVCETPYVFETLPYPEDVKGSEFLGLHDPDLNWVTSLNTGRLHHKEDLEMISWVVKPNSEGG